MKFDLMFPRMQIIIYLNERRLTRAYGLYIRITSSFYITGILVYMPIHSTSKVESLMLYLGTLPPERNSGSHDKAPKHSFPFPPSFTALVGIFLGGYFSVLSVILSVF